jgi:hypothetical protein
MLSDTSSYDVEVHTRAGVITPGGAPSASGGQRAMIGDQPDFRFEIR